jgi:predicted nuclease with TOPRIM domain
MSVADGLRRVARRFAGQGAREEDERLIELFRNRAELKKELQALDDERQQLLDRLKLQEGATVRVEEQLAALEQYLGRPDEGYKCLAYFQLRAVWRGATRRLEQFSGELARQQMDRERKQQLAVFERAKRERLADVDRELLEARVLADQLQAEQRLAEQQLAGLNGFWNHFRRRRRREALEARRFRIDAAVSQVTDLSDRRHDIDSESPPLFEGLSLDGRRTVNLAVIAYADALHDRIAAAGLAELVRQSKLRRVYETVYGGREECLALMQRAGRLVVELEHMQDDLADVKVRTDRLRASAAYRNDGETVPRHESLKSAAPVLLEEYFEVHEALLR